MFAPRSFRAVALGAVAGLAALSFAACGSDTDKGAESGGSGSSAAFPVTVQHAFGETTITKNPVRVATVAWANHEVPLALGVVPVGMSKATWGDDDNDGVLPWVEEKLTELDAETPVLFDETEGIDFEAVANTRPDVILASYSGLTREEYDTLSKIAPVVAEPGLAWATTMEEMIELNSTALGLEAEGKKLIDDLDAEVKASLDKHPVLKDKKVLFSYVDPSDTSKIGFYTTHDTRPSFLAGLGLPVPKIVTEVSAGSETFFETVSAEKAAEFSDVDVLVEYGETDGSTQRLLQGDALIGKVPAVQKGAIAILENGTPLAASANPSPLSIGWGIDQYFALLAAAAEKA